MKKNWQIIILLALVCYAPTRVFAGDPGRSLINEPAGMPDEYYEKLCEDSSFPNQYFDGYDCTCMAPYVRAIEPGEYRGMKQYSTAYEGKYYTHKVYLCEEPEGQASPEINLVPPPSQDITIQKENIIIPIGNSINIEGEVSLRNGGEFLEGIKNDTIQEDLRKNIQSWEQKINEAEQKGQFKDGIDKDEYLKKTADEKTIKEQIASLALEAGFNHQRILESTGASKYDYMSTEYKKRFPQPAETMFDGSSNAVEFEKARSNIEGAMKQTKELKNIIQNNYSFDWKTKYLDVPEKPTIEKQQKETGSIWDILLKSRLNK